MNGSVFNAMIEQALLQVHTGFIGKVVSVDGNLATVQPLNMVKPVGGQPAAQALVENCPVLDSAVKFLGTNPAKVRRVQGGDVVYWACADRYFTAPWVGVRGVRVAGHNMVSSTVVVGIL